MEEQNKDVIGSAMKLMRTLRRKENPAKHESRGAGKLLRILQENDGMSSRELADRMGIRPASLWTDKPEDYMLGSRKHE